MNQAPENDEETSLQEGVERIAEDLARLRKTLLRHGHAQEHFQQQVSDKIDQMAATVEPQALAPERPSLNPKQLRALLELDQSLGYLLDLAKKSPLRAATPANNEYPTSLREGLDFLQIRLTNLQRSFKLEPIPTVGRSFDDRLHRAESTSHRPDLPDGVITEELLPGYLLDSNVVRPALVVINQAPPSPTLESEDLS